MDDAAILALYAARSEQAISETRTKYGQYCISIAYRILASIEDSQECVSDTWLKAWETIPPAKPDDLRAYLGRITRNNALHRLRDESRLKRGGGTVDIALSELDECVTSGDTPENALLRQQLSEAVNRFLRALPQQKRVVFVLRYYYLYSTKEIARKTGLRENTVSSILFRLRKQLKSHLEQEGVSL